MVYKDCCSIYVAYGFEYFMMAVNSARSLKKNNPGLPIILITNVSIDNPTIDDELLFHEVIYRKENTDKNRIEKISVDLYSPFLKTVYLDCDTEVYGDLSLVFRALDRFDIAIRQSPIPTNKRIKVMNDLFAHDLRMPSWNAGVIFFHKNERSEKLFVRWREIYLKEVMRQDQPSLMRAIIETEDLRLLNLSAAWNAKPISTHELNWLYKGIDDIIILHYRRPYLIPSIAKNINDLFSAVNHRFQIIVNNWPKTKAFSLMLDTPTNNCLIEKIPLKDHSEFHTVFRTRFCLKCCIDHWVNGLSWKETGIFDFLENIIKITGKSVDSCRNRNDLEKRYENLDLVFNQVKKEGRFRNKEEIDPVNYREGTDKVIVHIGPNGQLLWGKALHQYAIAYILKIPFSAQIGIVHYSSIQELAKYREIVKI